MTDTFGVDDALEHIERLRHGETLTTERASAVLGLHRTGRLADYQLSSWLATIAARGLRFTETVALTRAYLGPARRGRGSAAAGGPSWTSTARVASATRRRWWSCRWWPRSESGSAS